MLQRFILNVIIFILWLISFLPMAVIIRMSQLLQKICYSMGKNNYSRFLAKKYHVARVNLQLCFPEKSPQQVEALLQANFTEALIAIFHYGYVMSRSKAAIIKKVKPINWESVAANYHQRPIILLAPHFWGLDIGASRNSIDFAAYSMMHDDNSVLREKLKIVRTRFMRERGGEVFGREEGISKIIRRLRKDKICFYYLPDIDLGETESVFLPFLGHRHCATLTSLSRLTRLSGAVVIPVFTIRKDHHYLSICDNPWENFPSGDDYQDALRMNQFVEEVIRQYPEQYMWDLQRFGTQPNQPYGALYHQG